MGRGQKIDMAGKRIGRLTVIREVDKNVPWKKKRTFWLCKCDCGKEVTMQGATLRFGVVKSCGCYRPERPDNAGIEIGKKFGFLTVLARVSNTFKCRCDCGKIKSVPGSYLLKSRQPSCGCKRYDALMTSNTTHGASRPGKVKSEYRTWSGMIQRCHNPNNPAFEYYGGRGIEVWEGWRSDFLAFYEYIGPKPSSRHSVDRIDNSKGYVPGNVRWATNAEQSRNRRANHVITFQEITKCVADWERDIGLYPGAIHYRLEHGWSIERALSAAKGKRGPRKNPVHNDIQCYAS